MGAPGSATATDGPQNTTSPEPSPPVSEPPATQPENWAGVFLQDSAATTNPVAPGETGNGAEEPEDYPQKGLLVWIDRNDDGYIPGSGQGAAISGRVTDPWGNGIAGAYVRVFEVLPDGSLKEHLPPDVVCLSSLACPPPANPRTDIDGYFSAYVGSPGSYKLYFTGTLTGPNFLQWVTEEWYDNRNAAAEAAAVPAGSSGLDVVLIPNTSISGNIDLTYYCAGPSQYACRANPPAVQVHAYRGDRPEFVAAATVTSFIDPHFENYHHFHFYSLPAGEYKLVAIPDYSVAIFPYGNDVYEPTWFDNAESWESARKISVSTGQSVTIENFSLLKNDQGLNIAQEDAASPAVISPETAGTESAASATPGTSPSLVPEPAPADSPPPDPGNTQAPEAGTAPQEAGNPAS